MHLYIMHTSNLLRACFHHSYCVVIWCLFILGKFELTNVEILIMIMIDSLSALNFIQTLSKISLYTQRRPFRAKTPQYIHAVTMPVIELYMYTNLNTVSNNQVNRP